MRYLIAAFLLTCSLVEASESPLVTVLPNRAHKDLSTTSAALHGFLSCDAATALPKELLSPLGVKFADTKLSHFAYPKRITTKDRLLLEPQIGPLTSSLPFGKWLSAGGVYHLQRPAAIAPGVLIKAVGQIIDASDIQARVGVMFEFESDVASLSSRFDLRPRAPAGSGATFNGVWFTVDQSEHTVWCWRRLPLQHTAD